MAGTWRLPGRLIETLKKLASGMAESEVSAKDVYDLRRWEFIASGTGGNSGEPIRLTGLGEAALKRHQVIEEAEMAKAKAKKVSGATQLAQKDAAMKKKYPHYVAGSIRKASGLTKLRCDIKCTECGETRTIFTSDAFQVKKCVKCKAKGKAKPKKAKAKPKKAKAKKSSKPKPAPSPEPEVDETEDEEEEEEAEVEEEEEVAD